MTFEEFVASRLAALLRYATVVTWNPHLAEDVVQEVLVRAQPRWGRISRVEAPERYVQRMVVNEFLSWRRRAAARLLHLGDGIDVPEPDHAEQHADRDAMMRLIGGLPPRQRAVIALRFYEDMSVEEIADVLSCRTSTVRTHLSRAMDTLRAALPGTLITTKEAP
ncbi:SigE family RNA polymerase sigma factor [Dactylosporangium sp. NPDC050588]|uniref:SigE family RNA polymerase sigma factor n=1 Tax=Dactylosporangium sp. NPDC050588 TaxID=3157211 RepID=UPI0033E3A0C4